MKMSDLGVSEMQKNIIRTQNSMLIEKLAIIKALQMEGEYKDRVIRRFQSDVKTLMMYLRG